MDILKGIQNFLSFINDNWTSIMVIIGLCIALYQKIKNYIRKSREEKIEIAKTHIHEMILKMVSDAEADYEEWSKAGSIKRSQVISDIFMMYPVLSKVVNQEALVVWIDNEIDNALNVLKEIIDKNKKSE